MQKTRDRAAKSEGAKHALSHTTKLRSQGGNTPYAPSFLHPFWYAGLQIFCFAPHNHQFSTTKTRKNRKAMNLQATAPKANNFLLALRNSTVNILLIPALIALLASGVAFGQESSKEKLKADRKEWKKRLKSTDPLAFKKLVEDRDAMQMEILQKTDKLTAAETKLKSLEEQTTKMNSNLEVATAPEPNTEDRSKLAFQTKYNSVNDGVVFKVQVGAFRNKDLAKYLDNNPNFSGDTDEDGARKYTLGYFKNYWEADNFKKYLREMGVADAWLVSYKDGKRVPIKDVLEGAAPAPTPPTSVAGTN